MTERIAGIILPNQLFADNYIRIMIDWGRGGWCEIGDRLYWRFTSKHKSVLVANPQMQIMVFQMERMEPGRLKGHITRAVHFLAKLFSGDRNHGHG